MSEKKCDSNENENENENDVLDLPSLEIVTFGGGSFADCHVAVFESMWWLLIFISFLILDLPKLHTISFNGVYSALQGDDGDNRKTIINGHKSYDNTLIMKSKLKWNVNCELCFDNDCLDLPSLTQIKGNSWHIHKCIGHVILEGTTIGIAIWFRYT